MHMKTEEMIRAFNEAFAANDISFMRDNMTEDIVWHRDESSTVSGKQEVLNLLNEESGEGIFTIHIDDITIQDDTAKCNGKRERLRESGIPEVYAFSEEYHLSRDGKIQELTSRVTKASE